jgi:hypothetical protein
MCRTAILGFALACLTAGGAYAVQGSAPAKTHTKATAAAGAHGTRHAAPARGRHPAAAAHTRAPTQASTTRKPTPTQAGRRAGRAIRHRLAQKQAARRSVALRVERSRAAARPGSQHASHEAKETQEAPAMDLAAAAPMLLIPPAWTGKTERPQAPARSTPRGEARAPAQTQDDGEVADGENAPVRDDAAPAETRREKPAASDAPGAGREKASLEFPRGAMPAPLRGSHESLERQNTRLDEEGLERIEDEADLVDRIDHKLLVPIPASGALTVNAELPATHRYCRPWTARFLADLARAHDAAFHKPLEVSSAVRTVEYQKRLMETNGNAAPAEGDIVSPHLTGATIDIAKDSLSRDEIAWMRRRLLALETAGKIDVEEEFQQSCFHITVYKSYTPPRAPRPAAQAKSGSAGSKRHKAPDASSASGTQGM